MRRAGGSSPRGRGKLDGRERVGLTVRLIPARAGKTAPCPPKAWNLTAHPRAGGENAPGVQAGTPQAGSSPRGRGKQSTGRAPSNRRGLIPARAGKTPRRSSAPTTRRAHPRAGGENADLEHAHRRLLGSSPRGRGKLNPRKIQRVRERLIPARAGKTYSQPWPPSHP